MLSIIQHIVNLKDFSVLIDSLLKQIIVFISLGDFRLIDEIFVR